MNMIPLHRHKLDNLIGVMILHNLLLDAKIIVATLHHHIHQTIVTTTVHMTSWKVHALIGDLQDRTANIIIKKSMWTMSPLTDNIMTAKSVNIYINPNIVIMKETNNVTNVSNIIDITIMMFISKNALADTMKMTT